MSRRQNRQALVIQLARGIIAATLTVICACVWAAPVEVSLPDVRVAPGGRVTAAIEVSDITKEELSAAEFTLLYDPSVVSVTSVTTSGGLAQGWLMSHKTVDGQVGVAMASARPTSGSGALLFTEFEALPCATGVTELTLARVRLNRNIPVTVRNGSIAVDAAPLTEFAMDLPAAWDLVSLPAPGDSSPLGRVIATAYGWDARAQRYALLRSVGADALPPVTGGAFVRHTDADGDLTVRLRLDTDSSCVREASTTLYPGWNIVGAPAADGSPVSVVSLRSDGSTGWSSIPANAVFAYDPADQSYAPASQLQPGRGHWIYNGSRREQRVSLPQARDLTGASSSPQRRVEAAPRSLTVRLRLTTGSGDTDEVSLVMSRRARTGFDPLDLPAPPQPPGRRAPRLRAVGESGPAFLRRSARPMTDGVATWTIAAEGRDDNTLDWETSGLPGRSAVMLWPDGSRIDLGRPGSTTLAAGARRFVVRATVAAPHGTRVHQNFPNPFNPETWIPFELAESADVRVHIYDTRGLRVRSLDIGWLPAGHYVQRGAAARWDGRNTVGSRVSSGVYFVELLAGDLRRTQRMVVGK